MFGIFRRHTHDWQLVAINDKYKTNFTDTGETREWEQRFYQCACGERNHTDNRTRPTDHKGIEKVKKNWVEAGVVPAGSYYPGDQQGFIKPSDAIREEIDPVLKYQRTLEDMQKTLGVVLNRDFDLEAKYPKLKKAADDYHQQLEKYKMFDQLKDKK